MKTIIFLIGTLLALVGLGILEHDVVYHEPRPQQYAGVWCTLMGAILIIFGTLKTNKQ